MNESQLPPSRSGLIGRLFGRGAEPRADAQPPGPEPIPPAPPEEQPDGNPGEPSIPAPEPDLIPPPGPGGPELPGTGLPEPEIPPPGIPGDDIPFPVDPDVPAPPGLASDGPAPHAGRGDDSAAADAAGSAAHDSDLLANGEPLANGESLSAAEREERIGWLTRLRHGLSRSSVKLTHGIGALFGRRRLDDEALEDLEDLLIGADLGVETARRLSRALAKSRFDQEVTADEVRAALAEEVAGLLAPVAQTIAIHDAHRPHVILVCGVNGSGKTTTIAKMARLFRQVGFGVVLAAGDTFRAAAIEQLQIWGERVGCEVIARAPGADPASLAYEAYAQAKADGADVLIIDTAGRLHNKADLMAELQKMARVLKRLDERAPHDVVLVLDATVGQNAHAQVDVFRQMVDVTGLVVTKLDGSAKGGVVVSLAHRFGLPVYFLGVGEGMDDMRAFEPHAFARGLLGLDA